MGEKIDQLLPKMADEQLKQTFKFMVGNVPAHCVMQYQNT
jgi:hypothetical protein